MTEKELNEEYIRNKTGLVEGDELIPIINEMLSERYIMGLEQGKFDKQVELEEKNKKLKHERDTLQEALFLARTKCNNDKARYRRKYREKRDNWKKLTYKLADLFNETQEVIVLDILQIMQEIQRGDSDD